MKDIIWVKNLTKEVKGGSSRITLLDDINLSIRDNEYIAIMGPSGSGKSTLLSILSGLDNTISGDVAINGVNIKTLNDNKLTDFRNENIGIVFQSFNLIPVLTAEENVEIPLFFSSKRINPQKKVSDLLKLVGLYEKRKMKPAQLSGGEQQRIAIARALAAEPKVLFADEPTGALDSRNGQMVMDIFQSFKEKYGMTIVMVTHDKKIAEHADRIIHIEDGKLRKEEAQNEVAL